MVRALRTVTSMCSSTGRRVRSSEPRSARPMWACDSMRPGISVAPAPLITVAPSGAGAAAPGVTCVIRLPSTRTAPRKGSRPVPSRIRALVIRWLIRRSSLPWECRPTIARPVHHRLLAAATLVPRGDAGAVARARRAYRQLEVDVVVAADIAGDEAHVLRDHLPLGVERLHEQPRAAVAGLASVGDDAAGDERPSRAVLGGLPVERDSAGIARDGAARGLRRARGHRQDAAHEYPAAPQLDAHRAILPAPALKEGWVRSLLSTTTVARDRGTQRSR